MAELAFGCTEAREALAKFLAGLRRRAVVLDRGSPEHGRTLTWPT